MAPASYDVGPAQSDLALMTKPAATEMLRFRTTGGAENGEGGDLEKPLLAVLSLAHGVPRGQAKILDQPMKNCAPIKTVKSFFLAVLTVQL
jgi:hypothetical protein